MNFQSRSVSNVTLINISGRVDISNVLTLKQTLMQISTQHPANIIINLENVSFMDSSGLAVLIQGMRRCREYGGDLFLCSPQKPVRMVFELTRLDKALLIFEDEHEALAKFQNIDSPIMHDQKS